MARKSAQKQAGEATAAEAKPEDVQSGLPPKEEDRSAGGALTHLAPEAKALVLELLIAGKSNAECDYALVRAKHLKRGQSLSGRTYATLRSLPEAKVNIQKLTEEAIQVGHAALSEALVLSAQAMRAGASAILTPDAKMRGGDAAKLRVAAAMMFKGAQFIWDKLGWQDVLAALNAAEKEAVAEIERANMNDDEKAELTLQVKENFNVLLREALTKRRARAAQEAAVVDSTESTTAGEKTED